MMFFLIYVMIGTVAGTILNRFKSWKGYSTDGKFVACTVFGGLWFVTVPMSLCVIATSKVLDKFTKV